MRCFSVSAVQKLHGDEGSAVVFADFVDRADVGMVQRGSGAGLAAKAFERLRIVRDIVRKKFQSDEAAERSVFGFVDDAHAAAAEFFDNAVMRDGLADIRIRAGHAALILKCPEKQVNEDQLLTRRLEPRRLINGVVGNRFNSAF